MTKRTAPPIDTPPVRSAARKQKSAEPNDAPLNFRVSADLKRRFRMYAAARDMKLNELLRQAFEEYEENHPYSYDTVVIRTDFRND